MVAVRRHLGPLIWAIKEAIIECYSQSNWIDLGYQTDCQDYIKDHPRLLRSLRFDDDDYPRHVLNSLDHIVAADSENLGILLKDRQIRDWLQNNRPELFMKFVMESPAGAVTTPTLRVNSLTVKRAISDAEKLIRTSGPTSSVDRIHTALHGYLIATCSEASIKHGDNSSIMEIFSLLRNEHPAFQDLGSRANETTAILRSLSKVIDKLNPVRNEASLAHPNEQLLDEPEAFLMINAARTVLHYLDAKLAQDHYEALPQDRP